MKKATKTLKQHEAVKLISNNKRILLSGGSRSAKSVSAVFAILTRALLYPGSTHLITRRHRNTLRRSIFGQTLPETIKLFYPELKGLLNIDRTQMTVTFPNGSMIICLGLDNDEQMDKILGMEFASVFIDELSEISYSQFSVVETRLAQKIEGENKIICCCNPTSKTSWVYTYFVKQLNPTSNTAIDLPIGHLQMNPVDNLDNIADDYLATLESMPERQKKRFLFGEWVADIEGALFNRVMIERNRVNNPPEFERIIVGVDPAVTSKKESCNTGIVVVAEDEYEHYYVLRDGSINGSPKAVARRICALYKLYNADKVIAETNQGGDYIIANVQEYDSYVAIEGVHHKKGKSTRAEPISYLYETDRVHHLEVFQELEDEMCMFLGKPDDDSDRLDGLVIGLNELTSRQRINLNFADDDEDQEDESHWLTI